jgi:formylglycine-generating enzyme required for sulfatase activity
MISGLPGDQLVEHPDWRHSAFGKCLLTDMEDLYATGHLSTGALADRLKKSVPSLVTRISTSHHQTPRVFATHQFDLQFTRLMGQYHFAGKQAGESRELAPGIVFHWCPSGNFTMGSPQDEADRHANEGTAEVSLTGFWLGETEITQGQWNSLMNSHPIEADSATEFCRLLTQRERKAGRLPNGWKYALPTEAQWEYACRAGSTTRFCFGDDDTKLSQYAWWGAQYNTGNARPEPYPNQVAARHANAWGFHDMHGNVWEWCSDWFVDALPGGRNPQVHSAGSLRVCRGGCWLLNSSSCRSAIRSGGSPDNRNSVTGFRVAAVPSTE